MDTVGAAIGPSLALLFLAARPGRYSRLFVIAFVPGLIAVALTFFLREGRAAAPGPAAHGAQNVGFLSYLSYWRRAPSGFRYLVSGLLLFTLFNSSDAFLLLALKNRGISDTGMIGFYIFYNLAFALLSFPVGVLADRIGLKTMLVFGLLTFSVVYFFFGFAASAPAFAALFFLYGLYASATEGIQRRSSRTWQRSPIRRRPWVSSTVWPASPPWRPAASPACCGTRSARRRCSWFPVSASFSSPSIWAWSSSGRGPFLDTFSAITYTR